MPTPLLVQASSVFFSYKIMITAMWSPWTQQTGNGGRGGMMASPLQMRTQAQRDEGAEQEDKASVWQNGARILASWSLQGNRDSCQLGEWF